MGGYEEDWFVDKKETENYICAICMNVAREVVTTSCTHIFCKECMMKNSDKCPTCNTISPTITDCPAMDRIILKMSVFKTLGKRKKDADELKVVSLLERLRSEQRWCIFCSSFVGKFSGKHKDGVCESEKAVLAKKPAIQTYHDLIVGNSQTRLSHTRFMLDVAKMIGAELAVDNLSNSNDGMISRVDGTDVSLELWVKNSFTDRVELEVRVYINDSSARSLASALEVRINLGDVNTKKTFYISNPLYITKEEFDTKHSASFSLQEVVSSIQRQKWETPKIYVYYSFHM